MAIKERILIVDDEEDMRTRLKKGLKKQGYSVETAEDGDDALNKLKNNGFNLVTLDIRMPGKSWREVLKTIKQSDENTWVTMVSVAGDDKIIEEAERLGADDYIVKGDSLTEDIKEHITAAFSAQQFPQQEELIIEKFQKEEDAYLQMEEELLENYPEEFIAILDGKVVAHGKDEKKVAEESYRQFGDIPIYIRQVGEEIPTFTV